MGLISHSENFASHISHHASVLVPVAGMTLEVVASFARQRERSAEFISGCICKVHCC